MSTSETVDFELGPCPCGGGKLIKRVTTQDNPWSSADISYSIATSCPLCSRDWRVDGQRLVNVRSEAPYYAAAREKDTKYAALTELCDPLVDSYFRVLGAKTKKAEHTEMLRLDIYCGSYRNFLADKKENKSCSQIAYGLRNHEWLAELAKQAGISAEFDERLRDSEDAEKRSSEAAAGIISRPIPALTTPLP